MLQNEDRYSTKLKQIIKIIKPQSTQLIKIKVKEHKPEASLHRAHFGVNRLTIIGFDANGLTILVLWYHIWHQDFTKSQILTGLRSAKSISERH